MSLLLVVAGIALGLVVVGLLSLRFPQGRPDWPLDGTSTLYLGLSVLTLVFLLVAMYLVTRTWTWPPLLVSLALLSGVVVALVSLSALFLPRGLPRA